jgi:hypothetical protein
VPDDNRVAPFDRYEQALTEVTAIIARLGSLLGRRITVEPLDPAEPREITGRLTSAELAQSGDKGAVIVWLAGQNRPLPIRRLVHEDAEAKGIPSSAGPRWLE